MRRLSTAQMLRIIDPETGEDIVCIGNEHHWHNPQNLFIPIMPRYCLCQCPVCKLVFSIEPRKCRIVPVTHQPTPPPVS